MILEYKSYARRQLSKAEILMRCIPRLRKTKMDICLLALCRDNLLRIQMI